MLLSSRALAQRRGTARIRLVRTDDAVQCGRCLEMRPHDAFYPSVIATAKGGWCKSCTREYYRDLRQQNPHMYADVQRKQRAKKRDFVRSFKKECAECGENHPAVLDLHHTDPSVKEFNLSWAAANNRATDRLAAEIAKCVVLCANCHRKLHWQEKQSAASADNALSA